MKWERKAPDAPGDWVRINVVGKPQLHNVFETKGGELSLEDGLWLLWGWGGTSRLVHPGPKQATFLWLGPLPIVPDDAPSNASRDPPPNRSLIERHMIP